MRSSSLPNEIQESNHSTHNQCDYYPSSPSKKPLGIPPKVSRSEISTSSRHSSKSPPTPLLSLFTPPTPMSPPSSYHSSPSSSPSTSIIAISSPNINTVGLPTLFEGRVLSRYAKE